ncbi:MAG: hypothetical protein ABWW70_07850 [Thermoproteota archaeon]
MERLGVEEVQALKRLRKVISSLSTEELKAFEYIWENVSVGEIIAERDLLQLYGISKPVQVLRKLRDKELVERGEGCYNLAAWLRRLRKRVQDFRRLALLLEKV